LHHKTKNCSADFSYKSGRRFHCIIWIKVFSFWNFVRLIPFKVYEYGLVFIGKLKTALQSFFLGLTDYVCIRKQKIKTVLQSFLLSVACYVCIRNLKTLLRTSDTQTDLYDF